MPFCLPQMIKTSSTSMRPTNSTSSFRRPFTSPSTSGLSLPIRQTIPEAIPIAQFSLLLHTTDEYDLLPPLRDRMKLTLRFEYYSDEELVGCSATDARH